MLLLVKKCRPPKSGHLPMPMVGDNYVWEKQVLVYNYVYGEYRMSSLPICSCVTGNLFQQQLMMIQTLLH